MSGYLWLIRHAKSDWGTPGQQDHQRKLNARGKRDGASMQKFLSHQNHKPTWLWFSTAKRAVATAEYVAEGFRISDSHQVAQSQLYGADADTILDFIQQTPETEKSVALVAHNPGLTHLCNQLAPHYPLANLPTFGIVRFRCADSWTQLNQHNAIFDGFASPKSLVDFR